MTTLTDFLLARISEDEDAAHAVPPLGHNYDMGAHRQDERFTFGRTLPSSADGMGNSSQHRNSPTTKAHFTRWDPARVLAECEAKRRIVETHLDNESRVVSYRSPRWADDMTDDDRLNWRKAEARCAATDGVVRALVQVYADHPDYDPTWSA